MGVSVAAAIWLVSLRAASAGAPYVLGRWVPAAIGSTTGLVCVAALNPYLPGLQLPVSAQLGMWVGIFLSSATWEGVLERTAKRRVLVVGISAVADLEAAAQRGRRAPFEIVPADELLDRAEGAAQPLIPMDLAPVVAAQRPDLIVLADEHSCSQALERLLDITDRRFRVASLTSFYEYAFGCVPLRELKPLWFMSLLHVRQRAPRRPSKRLFDVVVAAIGLVFTAPALAVVRLGDRAHARSCHLPSDSRRRGRPALHDVQVPHDDRDRRGGRRGVRRGERPASHRRSAASCARRISTNCPSSGTSSRATCRSSARVRSVPSSSRCSRRASRSGPGGC